MTAKEAFAITERAWIESMIVQDSMRLVEESAKIGLRSVWIDLRTYGHGPRERLGEYLKTNGFSVDREIVGETQNVKVSW